MRWSLDIQLKTKNSENPQQLIQDRTLPHIRFPVIIASTCETSSSKLSQITKAFTISGALLGDRMILRAPDYALSGTDFQLCRSWPLEMIHRLRFQAFEIKNRKPLGAANAISGCVCGTVLRRDFLIAIVWVQVSFPCAVDWRLPQFMEGVLYNPRWRQPLKLSHTKSAQVLTLKIQVDRCIHETTIIILIYSVVNLEGTRSEILVNCFFLH